ncbi:PKD domain-containing protein [Mucilaginibacter celer]|nr:PKD domain-containing protein [Mucilaginibacter celer]
MLSFPVKSFSQTSSNEGSEFWVAFPTHEHDYYPDGTLGLPNLSIFITGSQSSSGKVSVGSFSQSFTVNASNVTEVKIPRDEAYIDISESDKTLTNKAIHITVDPGKPKIVVYAHIFAAQRSAASLIIPSEALGKSYTSVNFKSTGVGKNYIVLVATQPNTKIHLLKGNTDLVPGGVTLPKVNDVYEFTSEDDLTGTRVVSDVSECTSFAVFSGTSGSLISNGSCVTKTIDPLFQQCYPTKSLGYNYGLVPFSTQSTHFNHPVRTAGYHFRVVATEDGTHLTINRAPAITLNAGDFYSSELTGAVNSDSFIKADKPISVAQYALSQSCSNQLADNNTVGYSDPDMVILNPIEYNISNITIFSSSRENIREQYVNILIKTAVAASFRINGQKPAAAFKTMKNLAGYSYLQLDLSNYSGSTFNLKADEGFNAIAYGFGNVESYAYSAGTNLAGNHSLVAVRRADNTVIDSACVNDDYFFRLTLPYISTKIAWQMDANELTYYAINPPFTEIRQNGKPAYEYMLPRTAAYDIAGVHHIHIVPQYPLSECSNSATQDISEDFKVNDLPDVKIFAGEIECQNTVTFEDKTPLQKNIKQRIWDFGDPTGGGNNTATSQIAKHTYTRNGTYPVSLTVINTSGCESTKSVRVVITGNPSVGFNTAPVNCVNKPVLFTYTEPASGALKPIVWKWLFGDGDSTISRQNEQIYHSYKSAGVYQARLVVIGETGCPAYSEFKEVSVAKTPTGDFDFKDVCAGNAANFSYKGTPANDEKVTWDFGDSHSTSQNPNVTVSPQASHVYTLPGSYPVSMTISSLSGCETRIVKTIHIYNTAVTPNFSVENSCIGQKVSFKNTSGIESNTHIEKIEWYFDTELNPDKKETYIYPDINGPYFHTFPASAASLDKKVTVKLRIFVTDDCFYDVSKTFKLSTSPTISFDPIGDICENAAPIQLTQGKETSGLEGRGYYSGEGVTTDNFFDPMKAGIGSHLLTYNFISNDGCPNFASRQITVISEPVLTMPAAITITQGESVTLKPIVSGSALTFKWQPSDGLNYDNIAAPVARPTQNTIYTLTVSNGLCESQSTVSITVFKAIKPVNTFTPNADGVNDLWTIENIENYPQAIVQIFNRYGTELFHSIGYTRPWNGRYNDQEVPAGVYYYLIVPGKNHEKIAGYLTLLR